MSIPEAIRTRVSAGEKLRDGGSLDEAYAVFAEIVSEHPALAIGHFKLATVLARLDRFEEAEATYRAALALDPAYPEANNNLGVLLNAKAQWGDAEAHLRRALAERVDYYEAHLNVADVLQKLGRLPEALHHARRAAQLAPELPAACERAGSVLNSMGRMRDAIDHLETGVEKAGEYGPYWTTLAVALQCLGRHAEADLAHTRSVALAGDGFLPRMNQLYFSNYLAISNQELWDRHKAFGLWVRELLGAPLGEFHDVSTDPERRLRIGFVSGDFRLHSVSYFLPGVLDNLDRRQFHLYAYSVSHYQDDVTARLKPLFNVWRDAASLDHMALFEQIRRDRIDILIDLSGHTNDNRLMVFARRPAPVQVSYLGYPNTSGLDTMDFRITDAIADPPGCDDEHYSEFLWRLDRCFLCYSPPDEAPEVSNRPAGAPVVFGSFNSRAKYSEECLAAWSTLLKRVPNSRLVLKSLVGNADQGGRDELVERFVSHGVAPDRVEVLPRINNKSEHLDNYSRIDVALDTFPYNGTTTTCEALWMGVPVIALAGDRHAARVGSSILHAIGLPELVADSIDQYVDLGVVLAADEVRRRTLRAGMRQRMASSPLGDRPDMARAMGDALRGMWRRYCDEHSTGTVADAGARSSEAVELIKLHIGGVKVKEGWKILNIEDAEGVDFLGDIRKLSAFVDGSCSEIYASHVLEHLSIAEALPVFHELYRMLVPGGKLYVSVPDLETMCWMFTSPTYNVADKFSLMKVIYGGQTDAHDFHHIGYTFDFLVDMLRDAGFQSVEHVESLGLFEDTSELVFLGQRVSLNLIVSK